MTRTGDREICSVSGKLPDNPGELARMHWRGEWHLHLGKIPNFSLVAKKMSPSMSGQLPGLEM